MNYRRLGSSGLRLSELSVGTWVTFGGELPESFQHKIVSTAYDAGINFFDCAEAYSNGRAETVLGSAIKQLPRESIVVSSKVKVNVRGGEKPNEFGLSRKHIFEACRASLKRLQLDYLDLYFCHRPDPNTPIEETVRAMDDLVHQGKILYWGTSEWTAKDIMKAHELAKELGLVPPTMEQPEYNMLHRERVESEYAPLYAEIGLGTTVYSPLASGVLTGKYKNGIPPGSRGSLPGLEFLHKHVYIPEKIKRAIELEPIAEDLDCSLAQLSLAWCLKNPNVSSLITGVSKPEQIIENAKSLEVVQRLDSNVIERIDAVLGKKQ